MLRKMNQALMAVAVLMGATWSVNAQAADAADAQQTSPQTCSFEIQGNDAMRFSTNKMVVPKSCETFTVTLRHVGRMPKTVMGHNWVLTHENDYREVAKAGIKAGASAGFLNLPDERILAHTDLVGAGESSSVTFNVGDLKEGEPYIFFCSFPGHFAMMKGTLTVE